MRVLLVSHRFPPDSVAGVERITQSLAAELVKAGDTVSIVTRRAAKAPPEPATIRERLPDGTTLYRLVGGEVRLDRALVHSERLEELFRRALVEAAPDVVHILHLFGLSPRFIEIARRLRIPVVVELQDFYFACPLVHLQKPSGELCAGPDAGRECARTCFQNGDASTALRWGLRTAYFRQFLGMAERVVCPSRYVASYFGQFGVDPARIRVLPNGVSIEPHDGMAENGWSTPRERGRINLAFVGTVVGHKGVHLILDALGRAGVGAADLVLIGHVADERYADELRARAAAISDLRLRFFGAYEPRVLPHLLTDVDCVLTPSLVAETGAITAREAITRGVPVVATCLGALPEVVTDGFNGLIFDHRGPGELAAILRRLATDEALLRRLHEGARATRFPTVSERTRDVRVLYEETIEEATREQPLASAERAEIDFLHDALLEVGFGGPDARTMAGPPLAVARSDAR